MVQPKFHPGEVVWHPIIGRVYEVICVERNGATDYLRSEDGSRWAKSKSALQHGGGLTTGQIWAVSGFVTTYRLRDLMTDEVLVMPGGALAHPPPLYALAYASL